ALRHDAIRGPRGPRGEFELVAIPAGGARAVRGRSTSVSALGLGLLAACALMMVSHAWAAAFGSVSGSVLDAQSRAVSGARVRLESMASGAVRTAQTNAQGRFDFANVELGTYRLSVAHEGFTPFSLPVPVESGY